jgi:CheY-like chemotaxis protein
MTLRQSKVLIADDSNAVHQLIRDALPGDYSGNIIHAFDGVECLQALDHGVDLAFIDVHMPTMSGMDALWAARIAGRTPALREYRREDGNRRLEVATTPQPADLQPPTSVD